MNKLVVFLDGVSCVGKTTVSGRSVDFLKYVEEYPGFAQKNELMHIQYLYDHLVTDDILHYLDGIANDDWDEEFKASGDNMSIIDRSFYSTVAYDIIFKYKGDCEEPNVFQKAVDVVFEDKIFCTLLKHIWQSWDARFKRLYPTLNINLLWVIPKNVDKVINNLKNRGTFENNFGNLRNYIENQSYVFEKLCKITDVGKIVYVDEYVTRDIIAKYVE